MRLTSTTESLAAPRRLARESARASRYQAEWCGVDILNDLTLWSVRYHYETPSRIATKKRCLFAKRVQRRVQG